MKGGSRANVVFFEPWSLGDVMIAASVVRERPDGPRIACHSAWHAVVRAAFSTGQLPDLIPVDLPYTTRNRAHAFDARPAKATPDVGLVLSIRGDLRDFSAARKLFPGARIRMNGWVRFFGRKSALVNLPYGWGVLPVENRYRSWARLAEIPYNQVEQTYRRLQSSAPTNGRVVIHVGAQWRSKQFPDVAGLRNQLKAAGYEVILLAGPGDLLPAQLDATDVARVVDQELIEHLRAAEHVITNDSGPMHLAAFLGCRTTTIVRTSPIEEWLPPATRVVASSETPRGYRPERGYMSDNVLTAWPTGSAVFEAIVPKLVTA